MKKRHSHNVLPAIVGELELAVMEAVWKRSGQDARSIASELPVIRRPSLSTVQSTLERLVRKQLLKRQKQGGHAYYYFAAVSRGELLGSMLKDIIQLLYDGRANTILSSFVNVAANLDESALDELEALIRKKKRVEEERRD